MKSSSRLRWQIAMVLAGGLALMFVPPETTRPLRRVMRDGLGPGQLAVREVARRTTQWSRLRSRSDSSEELREELLALRQANRRLEIQAARLRDNLKRLTKQQGLAPAAPGRPPLAMAQLVEARVMGEESALLWRGKQMLSSGSRQGIAESALVLDSARPLVDLGSDADLAPGDTVYAGRIVIGKIADVGRYSSTLRLVTDPGYSGRARLARRTARGYLAQGTEGTLVGDGSEFCRLKHVTDPVNVGDEVFTGGADGLLPAPMYYGQVIRAELEPGAQEWSVWVKPAAALERLETVLVLRRTIHPERILAN